MTVVILPLTALPSGFLSVADSYIDWVTLGVVLGIPIAYNTYKYYGVDSSALLGQRA